MFISEDNSQTACETFERVKKLAHSLKEIGIKEKDKVALMALPHEKELYESFFAIQAIGAVPVLINFLNPPETVAYMFARTGAKTLIVGRDYRLRNGATRLAIASLVENVITIGEVDHRDSVKENKTLAKLRNFLKEISFNFTS